MKIIFFWQCYRGDLARLMGRGEGTPRRRGGCRLPEEGEKSGISRGSRLKLGKGKQTSLACQHMVATAKEQCRCDIAGDSLHRVCSNWKGCCTHTVWRLTCWQVWLTPVGIVWAFRCFCYTWDLGPRFLNHGCAEIHPFPSSLLALLGAMERAFLGWWALETLWSGSIPEPILAQGAVARRMLQLPAARTFQATSLLSFWELLECLPSPGAPMDGTPALTVWSGRNMTPEPGRGEKLQQSHGGTSHKSAQTLERCLKLDSDWEPAWPLSWSGCSCLHFPKDHIFNPAEVTFEIRDINKLFS